MNKTLAIKLKKWGMFLVIPMFLVLGCLTGFIFWLFFASLQPTTQDAAQWHEESWMKSDSGAESLASKRMLAITDLPLLEPTPTPEDFAAVVKRTREIGCNASVLSFSWPSLEPNEGRFAFEELKQSATLHEGRALFLGIQIVNTTVKDLPGNLQRRAFDDPEVLRRFRVFLDGLAPFLRNRVKFLSIGNESDVYFSIHPEETDAFRVFLNDARQHVKKVAPNLLVGTTLTDGGATQATMQELTSEMDAHFLTYYHGQVGLSGAFRDPATTKKSLVELVDALDRRPVVFQEIGFPAHPELGSPQKQVIFVEGVFDAWESLGDRVMMLNYFMMYDFPMEFVKEQVGYYGMGNEANGAETLAQFLGSLGLHDSNGEPRPAWEVFQRRALELAEMRERLAN